MNIKNLFASLRSNGIRENVLHTPYGSINLTKEDGRQQVKHIITQIQRNADALTRKDIADWRRAWQAAINIDNPNRGPLYDIYRDTDADAHLSGCIRQREGFVMAKSFKIVDGKEEDNPDLLAYFDHAWFKDLCLLVLDANYWGHSLVELGDIVGAGTPGMTYTGVTLLPRKHIIPEYGRVITEPGQDWRAGIDYRSPGITDCLIEAGKPDDLGLLLKATLHTIPKKNMLAFWDTFGEIFGMPMRIAKTASRDKKEVDRLNQMLVNAGASQTAVVPLDTELEFIESTRADAYHVYNERVSRANSEISKLIIGQTMTIEDGSSLSQSQTHLKVLQNLVEADADILRDVINNQLLPRMVRHGFPLEGCRFDWNDSIDYTPEQQVAYETMIADRYEVDGEYFAKKYTMPVGQRRENNLFPTSPDPSEGGKAQGDGKKKLSRNIPFSSWRAEEELSSFFD